MVPATAPPRARSHTRPGLRTATLLLALFALTAALAAESAGSVAEAEPDGDARVAVRPVPGAVLRGFEPPTSPYGPGHRGVALAAGSGDEVVAALDGVVTWAGPVAGVGWVTVDHGGGLDTTYGDLDPVAVTPGADVAAGDTLGWLAGRATHLHWGARRDGEYRDPLALLGRWRPRLVPTEAADDRHAPEATGRDPAAVAARRAAR